MSPDANTLLGRVTGRQGFEILGTNHNARASAAAASRAIATARAPAAWI